MTDSLSSLLAEIEAADLFIGHINHYRYTEYTAPWTCVIEKSRPGKYLGVALGQGNTLLEALTCAYDKIRDAPLDDIDLSDPDRNLGRFVNPEDHYRASTRTSLSELMSKRKPAIVLTRRI